MVDKILRKGYLNSFNQITPKNNPSKMETLLSQMIPFSCRHQDKRIILIYLSELKNCLFVPDVLTTHFDILNR